MKFDWKKAVVPSFFSLHDRSVIDHEIRRVFADAEWAVFWPDEMNTDYPHKGVFVIEIWLPQMGKPYWKQKAIRIREGLKMAIGRKIVPKHQEIPDVIGFDIRFRKNI